jgi:hypothetical protein
MADMQEREMWGVAVFRLRESANRIFSLATRVRSQDVRGELLRIYEQLRAEEAKLATLADAADRASERGREPDLRAPQSPPASVTEASDD